MRTVSLESICDIEMGQAPKGTSYNSDGVGYPLLAGAGDFGAETPCPSKYTIAPTKLSKPEDLLLCIRATVGDLNWSDREYCLGRGVAGLRPKNGALDRNYLWRWLESHRADLEKKARGSTFKQVSRRDIAELNITLPETINEQRRIADILDKADGIRRKRKQALAMADSLLQAAFLDMFGDPVSNPKRWPVVELGKCADEVRYGTSVKCTEDINGGLPVLRIPNIVGGGLNWDNLKYADLPNKEESKLRMKSGDIIFVRTNGNPEYIARCAIYDSNREAIFASYLIRIRLDEKSKVIPRYVWMALSVPSYRRVLLKETKTTAGNYNISGSGLKSLKIPAPPQSEQEKFEMLYARLSKTLESLIENFADAEKLFASLSQRAFRGEL